MIVSHERLQSLSTTIFAAAGCCQEEAEQIGRCLVGANLVGHDSHGVIRIPIYIQWIEEKKVIPNRDLKTVLDSGCLAQVDGQLGFGQVMGRRTMELAIAKATKHGVGIVGLRNSAHVGRVGDWAEMAIAAGKIGLCFVNTTGKGLLTAPFGGIDRRLSANPFAAGIPVEGGTPIVLDISASAIAEGKLKVAYNKGVNVPDGCIIDYEGHPTNDPKVFYADPPGTILSFGGHKGFGLGMVTEILAGALTGSGCSKPGVDRLEQGMLTIVLDPEKFTDGDRFADEVRQFVDFVKSSRTVDPNGEVLVPGEPERRTRAQRLEHGIEIDPKTWDQLEKTCAGLGVPV